MVCPERRRARLYARSHVWQIGTIDNFGIDQAMKVAVLALEGVFDTGLATVLDALSTANELASLHACPGPHFDVRIVGVRRRVHSAQRFGVPVAPVTDCPRPDCVIVPAMGYKMPAPLQMALARDDVAEAVEQAKLHRQVFRRIHIRPAAPSISSHVRSPSR